MKINRISIVITDCAVFLQEQIKALTKNDLSLSNPETKAITGYKFDGDRVGFDKDTGLESIIGNCAGVQMWFDESQDIFIAWDFEKDSIEVHVDGLSDNQVMAVSATVLNFVIAYDAPEAELIDLRFDKLA